MGTPIARLRTLAVDLSITVFVAIPVMGALGQALDESSLALETQEAQQALEARDRFERAAQNVCGENGAWAEVAPGEVQCFTHRGHKTKRVVL